MIMRYLKEMAGKKNEKKLYIHLLKTNRDTFADSLLLPLSGKKILYNFDFLWNFNGFVKIIVPF